MYWFRISIPVKLAKFCPNSYMKSNRKPVRR
jgi:hypothetical protein